MITALLITLSFFGVEEDATRIFAEANNAYHQGRYEEAANGYAQLNTLYGINSPVLLYNLGNACYMQGQLGKAILYYEAALGKSPDFDAARKNLERALGETQRSLPLPDARQVNDNLLMRYYPFSPAFSLGLTHGLIFAAIALLIVRHWWRHPRYTLVLRAALVFGLFFYGLAFVGSHANRTAPRLAVALTKEVPVYFGTNEQETPRFVLYEGDRVLADRVEGDWVRLYAYGGERGWARKDSLGLVEYGTW